MLQRQYTTFTQAFGKYVRANHHVSTVGNGLLLVSRGVMKPPTEREQCSGSCRRSIGNESALTTALNAWAANSFMRLCPVSVGAHVNHIELKTALCKERIKSSVVLELAECEL